MNVSDELAKLKYSENSNALGCFAKVSQDALSGLNQKRNEKVSDFRVNANPNKSAQIISDENNNIMNVD